jgi:hypothetical protein
VKGKGKVKGQGVVASDPTTPVKVKKVSREVDPSAAKVKATNLISKAKDQEWLPAKVKVKVKVRPDLDPLEVAVAD